MSEKNYPIVAVAENATTTQPRPEPLNMAECRSALEAIADSARTGSISTLPSANLILRTCEKALAAPPRNCDVGTPDEWYECHSKWCANERCKDCAATMCRKCFAEFMDKPYKQEGTKA